MEYKEKIKEQEELQQIVKGHRQEGKVVVHCHGCFDILHPGHVRYLEMAKKQGDILVVSLTADKFILKGDDRPYMPQELRINTMAALTIVDYVYLDDHSWAGPILEVLQPDIYVKGKEYESVFTGRFVEERKIVEDYGGTVFFSSGDVVFSSSQIIEDFKKRFAFDYEVFNVFARRNDITFDGLKSLINDFHGKRVTILGEIILDEYHYSEVVNSSGEAPILTIRPKKVDKFIGGSGIVAKHIKQLGGEAILFSFLGEDEAEKYVKTDLDKYGVDFRPMHFPHIPTIRKVRFIGDTQKLLKVDYSRRIALKPKEEEELIEALGKALAESDVLLFADFGYGIVANNVVQKMVEQAKRMGKKVIADTSGTMGGSISKYAEVFLVTPTEKEMRAAMDDQESGLSVIANKFLKNTHNENLIVTLGANGLLIFKNKRFSIHGNKEEHLQSEYLPAFEKHAIDPMGAGDAILAIISLAISAGGSLAQAAYLGSVASYIEVNKVGNIPITLDEIMDFLESRIELFNA